MPFRGEGLAIPAITPRRDATVLHYEFEFLCYVWTSVRNKRKCAWTVSILARPKRPQCGEEVPDQPQPPYPSNSGRQAGGDDLAQERASAGRASKTSVEQSAACSRKRW